MGLSLMDILFVPLLRLLIAIINLYVTAVFIFVIISLLEQFNVINRYNKVVYFIHSFLYRLCEPILARIRVFLPNLGGIDLSPVILIFGMYFIQDVLVRLLSRFPS